MGNYADYLAMGKGLLSSLGARKAIQQTSLVTREGLSSFTAKMPQKAQTELREAFDRMFAGAEKPLVEFTTKTTKDGTNVAKMVLKDGDKVIQEGAVSTLEREGHSTLTKFRTTAGHKTTSGHMFVEETASAEPATANVALLKGKSEKSKRILDFTKLKDHREWPTVDERGIPIKTEAQAKAYYDRLRTAIQKAEQNLSPEVIQAQNAVTETQTIIDNYLASTYRAFEGKSSRIIDKAFGRKEYRMVLGPSGELRFPVGNYNQAYQTAKRLHPDMKISSLTFEDYQKFGEVSKVRPALGKDNVESMSVSIGKLGEFRVPRHASNYKSFEIFNPETGKTETVFVSFTDRARQNYITKYNESLREARTKTADELYELAHQNTINRRKLENFQEIYAKEGLVSEARKAGLYDAITRKIDVYQMLSESRCSKATVLGKPIRDKHGNLLTGFRADIRAIKQAKAQGLEDATDAVTTNGMYRCEFDLDKLQEMAQAEQKLYEDFCQSKKALQRELRTTCGSVSIVKKLKAKAEELKNGDSVYQKAIQAFKDAFPSLIG